MLDITRRFSAQKIEKEGEKRGWLIFGQFEPKPALTRHGRVFHEVTHKLIHTLCG
jgi:hypothetical protein